MTTLWAKTGPDGTFLPLAAHLADAGAVADRLWCVALTDRQRRWFARALGGTEAYARSWVTFYAAAHDVGKAYLHFQESASALDHLLDPVLRTACQGIERRRHDAVSGAILTEWLTSRGTPQDAAELLAAIISGHHGVPRTPHEVRKTTLRVVRPAPAWTIIQQRLLEDLARDVGLDGISAPETSAHAAIAALAGLVSVADWIASDVARFPVTNGARRSSAMLALDAVGADAWSPPPAPQPTEFTDVFGVSPRPAQSKIVELGERLDPSTPALVVLEDRTGSGKTEAALWLALRALQGGARGVYLGMPTQATADQLHARVTTFLHRLWPDASVTPRLLHGGVHLDEDVPSPEGVASDGPIASSDAQQWFAQTRRGLLAPFAVGTIDQALLAVLNARHYPVRLWGLQSKVVIFDEVHAYDTYTFLLLERLVEWLAALDCSVVLLSATLPADRRHDLTRAYRRGTGLEERRAPASSDYPRITVTSATHDEVVAVTDDRPSRSVRIEWLDYVDDARAVADRALRESRGGGCIAVVCSTVAAAQERFRMLRTLAGDEAIIALLHARMRPLERRPIQRSLLEALGPPGSCARPEKLIVVATQVIEQSLDLDFDLMLSDLAPVDLLVQRAGRVHRHEPRMRPPRHTEARMLILDTPGSSADRDLPRGGGAVYVKSVLARTRLALKDRVALTEPDDLDELISAVYDRAVPAGTPAEQAWVAGLDSEAAEEARNRGSWARRAAVPAPRGEDPPWEEVKTDPLQDPDELGATGRTSAATRWSDRPSISLILLRPDELSSQRHRPDAGATTELLLRAVSVSAPQVVQPALGMLEDLRPSAWRRNGRLRHHLLVELDNDGQAINGELPLRLDIDEGVVIGG
jgi:CRISPR-associated endonuclease/helicase Cas3